MYTTYFELYSINSQTIVQSNVIIS